MLNARSLVYFKYLQKLHEMNLPMFCFLNKKQISLMYVIYHKWLVAQSNGVTKDSSIWSTEKKDCKRLHQVTQCWIISFQKPWKSASLIIE